MSISKWNEGVLFIARIKNLLIYFPDAAQALYDVVLLQMAVRTDVVVEVVVTFTVEVAKANRKRPLRKLSGVLKPGWMKTGTKGVSRAFRVSSSTETSAGASSTLNYKLVIHRWQTSSLEKRNHRKIERKAFETNSYFLDSKNVCVSSWLSSWNRLRPSLFTSL